MARRLRVYIAGAWVDMPRLREMRDEMTKLGFIVTSRWMDQVGRDYSATVPEFVKEANKDLEDIDKADFLIVDTFGETRGGREWESGYAHGRGKRLLRVGPIRNPFHTKAALAFDDWTGALSYLAVALEHADARDN